MEFNILWFRNNLRISDNLELIEASKENIPLLCIYIFDDEFNKKLPHTGLPKMGVFRKNFLFESLKSLKKSLQKQGNDLFFLIGKTDEILESICAQYPVRHIYSNTEDTFEEIQMENQIMSKIGKTKLRLFRSNTLIQPKDLPFDIEKLPDQFTQFRHSVEKNLNIRPVQSLINPIPGIPENFSFHSIGLQEIPLTNSSISDPQTAFPFCGGEENAIQRMKYYLWNSKRISEYKLTRNGMVGPDYSSKFSPWLANGSLSAVQIYHEVKKYEAENGANESTYWLIFELLWRDYFRFVAIKYGNKIFQYHGIRPVKQIQPKLFTEDPGQNFEKWLHGKTGNDFCNANMIELQKTGFMSNRGRQNVASYLCKDLKVDWRMGAEAFESLLIDYDPCSNWCNWMYIAGVGNDPRQDRHFNLQKQAENYDPQGSFRKLWLEN